MGRELRVGIIGCGKIAHVDHVPGFKSVKGVRIVSLLDIKRSQMDALREAHALDAEAYTDMKAFLASGLDAVTVCTPNNLHYPQTMAALKAGLHVLCEKPMAATTPETTRMIGAAKKARRVLHINHTFHFIDVYTTVADLMRRGAIGDPIHIRCIRAGGSTPDKGWSPGAKWFVSKKSQGGLILDIGVHMAEVMKWFVGDVAEVAARVSTRTPGIDVPDNVTALMRFRNGATGVLELSWTLPTGAGFLEIYGTKGALRLGFSAQHPIELITPAKGKRPAATSYPRVKSGVKRSQQCFVDAILGKAPSPTPGELGRHAIALCEAIAASGVSGRFVKVKQF